jgi:hypothetical protein
MNDRLVTHVTLVTNIKCVLGGVKVTDFNKVQDRREEWVGWLKNDSKAFGDYFVVSRRQKMKAFKDMYWLRRSASAPCFVSAQPPSINASKNQ